MDDPNRGQGEPLLILEDKYSAGDKLSISVTFTFFGGP